MSQTRLNHAFRPVAGAFAVMLALAGCSAGVSDEPSAAVSMPPSESMAMDGDHGDVAFEFGEPADAAEADRTVEIAASDDFAYDPSVVEVTAGETVTFRVTNTGQIVHEFVLGDEETQHEHEGEMAEMSPGMEMHDEPNAISMEPGETKEMTWTFTSAGDVLYGCHEPGHYDAGMVGAIHIAE